jgi:hypothetical protein
MLILQPGDIFATRALTFLGKSIRFIERLKAESITSEYNHAGIILDSSGKTFEALWHIENQNLFDEYKGCEVIIARWKGMTPEAFKKGYIAVLPEQGMMYPFYRIGLHFLGLAKFIHFGLDTVCSELTEKFLVNAGFCEGFGGKNWWGLSPEELADEWKQSKWFDIIFEGILPDTVTPKLDALIKKTEKISADLKDVPVEQTADMVKKTDAVTAELKDAKQTVKTKIAEKDKV